MSFGSTWRKWNLHIHTPDTVFNNLFTAIPPHTDKWETYLELLSKCDASVLGITDYFSINGYEKVKEFKDNGGLPNVELLIPNIELRIIPVTAGEKGINFHILCDPEIVDQLDNLLFNELKYRYKDNDYRCTKDGLIALGRAFRGPTLREEAAYEEGAHQFKVQYTDLAEIYRKSKVLREHSIRVVSNNSADGASGLQHNSLAATREEIYRLTQAIFSAQPKDREFFLGKGVLNQEQLVDKYGSLKPCIHGCDAHKNEEICRPDLNRFTFIKADPTFSGLKQIIFEPESRVAIRDSKPRTPAKSINTVELNFPSDCKMDDEKFCFGNSYQLNFSPNFTCIIGGRGTGKSTLLNLIGAKLQKSANEFFRSRQLKDNKGTKLQITDCIKIDGDHDEKNIEFLSQNEIEDFAKDPVKLTNAIYSRIINLDTEDTLKSAADSLQSSLTRLKQVISHTLELREGKKEVDRKKKEIESLTKMTNSFESDEYKKLTKAVASSLLKVNNITYSQTQYYGLIEKLEELVAGYRPLETDNEYITAGAELTASLNTIIDTHRLKDFSSIISQQTQFKAEYDTAKSNLQSYLQNAGVSTEDQKDIVGFPKLRLCNFTKFSSN
ncbi:hypothetical protein SAMN05660909_01317 [Chitinophaga terrae (ex Kim and Jung 2007)]|uniref:Uncharacterized protein n=2 Tax=Chitinophaga terrae (ex Kim and Jung 2007) TaxID=408074 RepID=A0A1H3ZNX0_9BACT|nr:ATP-binding protein [Chitinophaga terrae (ex Kim and Jung 2007)]SEA24932.1 hypothetical protein SAMN05660909_01317 [Chitinophaga terrae (ex Kim and Jung 2007)]